MPLHAVKFVQRVLDVTSRKLQHPSFTISARLNIDASRTAELVNDAYDRVNDLRLHIRGHVTVLATQHVQQYSKPV